MFSRERFDYSLGLVVLSGLLAVIPLYDMWEDVFVEGKTPLSTLLENSVFVLLTASLIALSVWLLRNDWEDEYVQLVARWSMVGTGVVALVYGWVLGFQLVFQNDLKPVIIAADGVVLGGIALFVAGVYNARSQRESAARAAERNRFSALFDNTSDAIAVVERDGDTARIVDVNVPFERTFDREASALVGQPIEGPVVGATIEVVDTPDTTDPSSLRALLDDPDGQVELRQQTPDGGRDFLVEYVPIGTDVDAWTGPDGFVIFTDITAQKERERQLETLSEGTEGLLDAQTTEEVVDAIRSLAADLFDESVVGVWRYDADAAVFRPQMATGTPVPQGGLPPVAAGRDDADTPTGFDEDALVTALGDRGVAVSDVVVDRLTESDHVAVCPTSEALSATERSLVDLLVANARTALEQVERQETLSRKNDQLEFVNSLLRHDIQNSMTIIRARGQVIAEEGSDTHADYAETIVDQSDDVIRLIDRFRALLDALTGDDAADLDTVSLSDAVEDRVATLRSTHPAADVEADVPSDVTVVADEMVENVLANVLGNAVEHNDTDRPRVTVSVREHDDSVVVRVADNGPGIPPEERDVVFRRGNRGLKEADIGSGFGLFFVDTMMTRYGGDVDIEPNDPRGTVFVLTFRTD